MPQCNGCGSCHRGWVDHVYKIKNNQLVEIGIVNGFEDANEPGKECKNGIFEDLFVKFEDNLITDHAHSPDIFLALQEKQGKFFVDLEETWLRNKARFLEVKDKLYSMKVPTEREIELNGSPNWIVLEGAVISKYCKKRNELREIMSQGERLLTKSAISEIKELLEEVIPGELNSNSGWGKELQI